MSKSDSSRRPASPSPSAIPTSGASTRPLSEPYTDAGQKYLQNLTEWLQDTRLMSEAISRLYRDFQRTGKVDFAEMSWPKKPIGDLPPSVFSIKPVVLAQRMDELLKNLWSTRFVFLETLWEEYLQDLVQELRHEDATVFEPFCERDFMAEVIRSVLTDALTSIDDVKNEVATRFATGITRQPWTGQWKQLSRLKIGLADKDASEPWFSKLAVYFEMRNCIIHLRGRTSETLRRMESYFEKRSEVEIWPSHLDFYRKRFIDCLFFIEGKIYARVSATKGSTNA